MKTVFSNMHEVAEAWAKQTQELGQTSIGRIFFNGPTIYSYGKHFPIATFIDTKKTAFPVVLVNSASYSNTTSKHQSAVESAIYSDVDARRIRVPLASYVNFDIKKSQKSVQLYFINAIQDAIDKSKRARVHKDAYIINANHLKIEYQAFSDAFRLNWIKLVSVFNTDSDLKLAS